MEKPILDEIKGLLQKERQVRKIRQAIWDLDGIMSHEELAGPRMFIQEINNEIANSPIYIAARESSIAKRYKEG